jgi:hypothetical protein
MSILDWNAFDMLGAVGSLPEPIACGLQVECGES